MSSEVPSLDPEVVKRLQPQAGRNAIDRAFELAAVKKDVAAEREKALRKLYEERVAFAERAKNFFDQLKSGIDGDTSTDKRVETYIAQQQKAIDAGLKTNNLSDVPNSFFVLAATHAASDREFLDHESFDASLRPRTEARAKNADEFFMRGAKMMFGDNTIPLEGISIRLGGMTSALDALKTPGMSPFAKADLDSIRSTASRLAKENPAKLLDQIQKLASLESLNGDIMEYNERVLLPALANNPAPEERKNLLWDGQRLAKILYELRLIEETLKKRIPDGVNPNRSERIATEKLRERIQEPTVKDAPMGTNTKAKPAPPTSKPEVSPARFAATTADQKFAERSRNAADVERQEKERLVEEVLKQGGVAFITSMKRPGKTNGLDFSFDKRWSSQTAGALMGRERSYELHSMKLIPERPQDNRSDFTEKIFDTEGIHELVRLQPLETYQDVQVEEEKSAGGVAGFFGRKEKVTVTKRETRPVADVSTVLPISCHEPAYALRYQTFDSSDRQHRSYDGRYGNFLGVQIILPESLAKKIILLAKADPRFMRRLIEKSLLQNAQDITEGDWSRGEGQNGIPVRPPYEAWSKLHAGKSRMYIDDQSVAPTDGKHRTAFRRENIAEF